MNDETKFLKTKSFRVALLFVALSLSAAALPSPWWEGSLLEVLPDLPPALQPQEAPNETVAESPAPRVTLPAVPPVEEEPLSTQRNEATATDDAQRNQATATDGTQRQANEENARGEAGENADRPAADPRIVALRDAISELATALGERPPYWEIPCVSFDTDDNDEAASEGTATGSESWLYASLVDTRQEGANQRGTSDNGDAAEATHQSPPEMADAHSEEPVLRPRVCTRWALDRFYTKLTRVALQESEQLARISQYGDSLVVGDEYTGELRRLLQEQFGDGGHGFVYIGNPERNFGYENVRLGVDSNWSVRTIVRHSTTGGGLFGLAGAEFRIRSNSSFSIQSDRDAPGDQLERLRLLYFAGPENDELGFSLSVDGERREADIELEAGASGTFDLELPRGQHRVSIYGFRHSIRLYGVISETSGPGAVVDNLGLVSARARHLLKIHPEHWQDQLALRDADLVSFFYGVNAAGTTAARFEADVASYIEEYVDVLKRATDDGRLRDCMVMSVLTRGSRDGGRVHEMSAVGVMAAAQREAALQAGCAFFDTHAMLESTGGARRWNRARPQLLGPDLSHPTSTGYDEIARRVYIALMHGYLDYLTRRVDGQIRSSNSAHALPAPARENQQ